MDLGRLHSGTQGSMGRPSKSPLKGDFFRLHKWELLVRTRVMLWSDTISLRNMNRMNKPSYEFNVVYLLSHIYRHLFEMGIGLRQLMDYYFVLVNTNCQELSTNCHINSTLKHLGLYDFAGAVMYVLKEVFGLEREYMICEPDEWRGKALLEDIMESGNFGKGQKKMPNWLRKIRQWSKLVEMYPSETLSDPVWRVYKGLKG